jgi:undecaprenyl-diphosphatase
MSIIEAIILGIVQGLTEFLPVSSSGHLTIGKEILGIESNNLAFEVAVHAATVLSTIVAFRKDILSLVQGLFKFRFNKETDYIFKIGLSMIPIFIVGFFLKDFVESLFGSGLLIVGVSLLVTSSLLFLSHKIKPKERELKKSDAFIIGISQALAVLPGLSRSGATISTGLMLGVKREEIARFSFLMILVPILGEATLELFSGEFSSASTGIDTLSLTAGFIAAFISGLFACKAMIALVKKAKLTGFAIYCALAGSVSIIYSLLF